jgi:methyl-accepting chemotaxis protein
MRSSYPIHTHAGLNAVDHEKEQSMRDGANCKATLAALSRSQAIIEFKMDGTIITANENFLKALGYTLSEVQGKHHSIFVEPAFRDSEEYRQFWAGLNRGEFQAAEYKRIGKGGREVWIQASYNPVLGHGGKPVKVVKFATDVTDEKLRNADYQGQIEAISKSQAVIAFQMDGTILDANENFLKTLGYTLKEIKGQHHSIFVEPAFKASAEYRQFWEALNRGEYQAAEYKRIGKGGREVWIQASYNPILDMNGRPFKVIKFATDVTEQVQERMRRNEIQIGIDHDLDGVLRVVETANELTESAASASTQTSANVQAVASGAEEMAASVSEITRQVDHAREISAKAVTQAEHANEIVGGLAEAASKIGDVISLINDIASQTNLLALNATIEAARAGDAGKGFAVVANEVKALAGQTARATDEIGQHIGNVQSTTDTAVQEIRAIGEVIAQISEISSAIAAAMEEQSAVTQDVSANMQTASEGVNTISQNMEEIAQATRSIEEAATKVKQASQQLT